MPVSNKGNWSKAAIGGLVLLNVVLLVFLVLREPPRGVTAEPAAAPDRSPSGPSSRTAASPDPTDTASGSAPAPTSSESSSTPTSEPTEAGAGESTRLLAANSDTLAWRAVFGPCPTSPEVEVSRDGGKTWRATEAGLRSVSRLRSYSESSVFAVGGAKDCAARYVATGGPTESWGANEGMLDDTWYRMPQEPHRVHAPGGRLTSPCGDRLEDFAGLGDSNAAALCPDGQLRLTQDSGRSWRDLKGAVTGVALGADDSVYAVATRKDGCDGVAVSLIEAATKRIDDKKARCAPVDQAAADQVAVSVRGRTVWLWAGSQVVVSTDGGEEWSRA